MLFAEPGQIFGICFLDNLPFDVDNGKANFYAGVAQLVEQLICNQQVVRSNRIAGSIVEECPSGQREQTVNLPAQPSEVQILSPPP